MELKIVDRTAISFNEAVGISEEKANELGLLMDKMNNGFKGQLIRTCDIFNEIAMFCNNTEELVFCTISHCNYMAINYGIFLCPTKKKS